MSARPIAALAATLLLLSACPRRDPGVDAAPDALAPDSDASTSIEDAAARDGPVDAARAGDFGTLRTGTRVGCGALARGSGEHWISDRDIKSSFVDGDDLLALVNRSPQGALPPSYAPTDMVDIVRFEPKTPLECERWQCLRKEAATAIKPLLAAMAKQGFPGRIESVYRSYPAQCVTFHGWVKKSDFCAAAEQSALPGHSQHQLGTAVDLFTHEWKKGQETVFRAGFGCTRAGQWLQEHSWEHGWVFPYPIHPDDRNAKQGCVPRFDHQVPINPRTGYRYEHWHLRYIGVENARAFHEAEQKTEPTSPEAITLEQWIRQKRGLLGDAELPVCDGCNCGACSTLSGRESACRGSAISLDERGRAISSGTPPRLLEAKVGEAGKWPGPVLSITVDLPEDTLTQPPFVAPPGPGFMEGVTTRTFVPFVETRPRDYPALPGAWRIGVTLAGGDSNFPLQAGLLERPVGDVYNRANLLLPAPSGRRTFLVPLPRGATRVRIALVSGDRVQDAQDVALTR